MTKSHWTVPKYVVANQKTTKMMEPVRSLIPPTGHVVLSNRQTEGLYYLTMIHRFWVISWVINYESFLYLEMQCLFHITSVHKIWKIFPSSIPVTCSKKRNKIWVIPPIMEMNHRNSMTQHMTHHTMSHRTNPKCLKRWSDKNRTIIPNCEKLQHSNPCQTLKNRVIKYRGLRIRLY